MILGAGLGLFLALVEQALRRAWVQVLRGRQEGRIYLLAHQTLPAGPRRTRRGRPLRRSRRRPPARRDRGDCAGLPLPPPGRADGFPSSTARPSREPSPCTTATGWSWARRSWCFDSGNDLHMRQAERCATTSGRERWVLEVVRGRDVGRRYPVGPGETMLGNALAGAPGFDLADQESNSPRRMAGRHACLTSTGECSRIRDLESPGGTFVNRQRLLAGQARPLQPGDLIQLGGVQLEVKREEPASNAQTTPPSQPLPQLPASPNSQPVPCPQVQSSPRRFPSRSRSQAGPRAEPGTTS